MGRDFLYYLVREDGKFCKVVNGRVVLTSTPTALQYTPSRWLEIEVMRQRNSKYFGVERSFTAPLDFVKDGGLILKYFYYSKGIEDKLSLIIADKRLYVEKNAYIGGEAGGSVDSEDDGEIGTEELTGYYYYYSALYKGEIDFSQFKHAGAKVTLNIMEGGVSKLLKANEGTQYDIAINDLPWIWVKMDGIYLHETKNYILPEADTAGDHLVGIFNTTQEGKAPGIASFDIYQRTAQGIDFTTSTDYFLAASQVVESVRFQGRLKFNYIQGFSGDGFAYIKTSQGRSITLASFAGTEPKDLAFDVTFDTQPNETYFLYVTSPGTNIFEYTESTASLTFRSRFASTYVKWVRPLDLYKAIAKKMGIKVATSAKLDTYKHVVVTSGDAIRGFDGAKIKTSLSNFFNSFNAIAGLGIGVEQIALLCEGKEFFADYSNPIPLGECKDLKVSPATEYIHNTIKIGYPELSFEDVNGRYEVNCTHVYTTPVTRVTKELNLVSDYHAGAYPIEYTRINFEGRTTTDGQSDNSVFVCRVYFKPVTGDDRTYYILDRTLNQYATGLLEPESVFNLWLSPKQCLLRNGSYIRSCFFNQDHEKIRFQSADRNSDLVITRPGFATITESGDIEISQLDAPIFSPNILEFENKLPIDILDLLKSAPGRCYSFTNDGIVYTGLPLKDAVKPALRQAQTFQLLSSPSNNLLNLITYDG